jgi:hypothetical protein
MRYVNQGRNDSDIGAALKKMRGNAGMIANSTSASV